MSGPLMDQLLWLLESPDDEEWNTYPMLTIAEFGLLLADCNPDGARLKLHGLIGILNAMKGNLAINQSDVQWPKYKKLIHTLRRLDRSLIKITKIEEEIYSDRQQTIHCDSKWRSDFLVYFAKKNELPVRAEMANLDKDFDPNVDVPSVQLDSNQLLMDGWFNLKACRAPKLVALIQAYVKEEQRCIKNKEHKFSTGNITAILKNDYEIIGDMDVDNFLKRMIHVASIDPSGGTFKKKASQK
jgi:hypothetical protein